MIMAMFSTGPTASTTKTGGAPRAWVSLEAGPERTTRENAVIFRNNGKEQADRFDAPFSF
jgi:hypothetical protein